MRFINDTLKLQFMKRILLLLLLCSTTLLMAQQTDPIQEAMASYDYYGAQYKMWHGQNVGRST